MLWRMPRAEISPDSYLVKRVWDTESTPKATAATVAFVVSVLIDTRAVTSFPSQSVQLGRTLSRTFEMT